MEIFKKGVKFLKMAVDFFIVCVIMKVIGAKY